MQTTSPCMGAFPKLAISGSADGLWTGAWQGWRWVSCTWRVHGARVACWPWADTLTRTGTNRPRRGSAGTQAAAHGDANSLTMRMNL